MLFVRPVPHAARLALAGALALALASMSCGSCDDRAPKDDGRDGLLVPPIGKQPLELTPLPQPPAITVAPGSIAGIPKGPVTVVVARPQGEVRGRELPSITFNKPLVSLGDRDVMKMPAIRIESATGAAVPGEWRWLGSSSVEFQPKADLPWATRFVVTVDAGLTAIDGEQLAAPYAFTFDTLRPELNDSDPSAGWRWLPASGAVISLRFNMPVKALASHVEITAGGKPVSYTVAAVVDEATEEALQRGQRPPSERSPYGQRTRYQLALPKLAAGADVAIALDGGLAAAEGPLRANPQHIAMKVAGPMRFTDARACQAWREQCPYGPVLLSASNEPDLQTLKGKVRFEPAVVLDDEDMASGASVEEGAWALLNGKFRAGTTYRVIVEEGVKDALGQSAPAFSGNVTFDDVEASVLVPSSLALLEAGGDDSYPIEAVNVRHVSVDVAVLTPASMAVLLADHRAPVPPVTTRMHVDTSSERNVAVRKPLHLGELFDSGAPRLFRLAISAAEVEGEPQVVIGQLTDLAAHAKLGATSGVVWVTSLKHGVPVAGAEVKLWDASGKDLVTTTTDDDGIAKVPGLAGLVPTDGDSEWWSTPHVLVSAHKDGDTGVTLSTWDGEIGPRAAGMRHDWDGDATRTLGVLVAERGIYRPGDEVFLKGIVRLRKRGAISLPKADSEMELIVDGNGKEVAKLRVPVSRFGTFSTKVKLPDHGPLGWYGATAKALTKGEAVELSTSFRVEEYRAPTFKVDVKVPSSSLIAGEPIEGRVEARYLFGGAMAGANVEASVVRETEWFEPRGPGLERYRFGVDVWGFDDGSPAPSSDVFAHRRATIQSDGGLDLALGNAEALAGRTTRYTVEAEVVDVSRRRVANRASVVVHPASVYAGVRTGEGFGEAGKPLRLELIAANIEGVRQSGVPLSVVVHRREWQSIKKKDPSSGRFITLSEPVQTQVSTCNATSDAAAPATCALVPDQAGLYVVEVTAKDPQGRTQTTKTATYVTGGGWVSWQRSEGELLELVSDQKSYEPGQTAQVLVKSPWPDAEALVTVEREGVSQVRRMKLTGAASVLPIPLDDTAIPNVFVSVVVVRGRVAAAEATREIDPGRPQVRVGYVMLNVEKKKKRLSVDVDPGPGTHRPGETLTLKLAVTDHAGVGVPAEVAVWAVDEAVLRLTDYALPDPVEALHPPRGLSVRLGEPLIFLVRRQSYGEKGRPPGGGGGGGGGGFRSNFKTTAFFVPDVVTDANGQAEVPVTLPDDLTTYRVMALAITEGDNAGSGRAEIVVKKPLLALPALPRLARVGDRFEAGVIVHAHSAGDVKVSVEVQGLALDGRAHRTVSMEAGKGKEVRFAMKAEAMGRARLRFRVEGGGESDALEQHVPVLLPTLMETVAAAGDTIDKRDEGLVPPTGVRPDVGGLDVTLAATALAGYQAALEQLVEYPYGCAEQLSSRLVPFLAVRELEGGFGITHKGGADSPGTQSAVGQKRMAQWLGFADDAVLPPDDVVNSTLRALEGLQDGDGGFLYWGTSSCTSPTASAYATLALFRAQELGYAVGQGVVARGQAFLADAVAVDKLPGCGGDVTQRVSAVDRAFAAWVLARTGKPKNSVLEPLFQRRKDLPLFAKAMLADAHVVGRDKSTARAQTLLQEVMNGARESAREVHFEETDPQRWSSYWSSDVRTSAVVLMTLVDAQPDHPFVNKIAQYLKTARTNGRYRSTQEAAFALMAVSELVRAKERDAPDFVATVALAGQPLVEEDFRGRNLDIVAKSVPMAELLRTKGGTLTFAKVGDGTLSYTASLRYAKVEMPTTPMDAGIAVQRWIEPFAAAPGSGQARKVRAGELVRVRVRVGTSSERRFVAIDVPMPAGLELVDDTLASSASASRKHARAQDEEEEECDDCDEPYVWTAFNHTELRDDRAVFFADLLPPGVHTATVIARATTLGSFVLQPATAEEMYAPEVRGRSDGGTFAVLAD